jgi:hypothetical protein
MKIKSRRDPRNFFIPKSGQSTYGLVFVALSSGGILGVLAGCLASLPPPEGSGSLWESLVHSPQTQRLLFALTLQGFLNLIVSFTLGIIISHRTFGPIIIPIRRHIENLISGNYTSRVKLRKSDHFQDLAEQLNKLAETLESKAGARESA